jgi:hypothetical protein
MSFLQHYRTYTSGTEAHPTYHTFSALVALSSIASRKVWIDMGHFQVYPNLYVVLVGPPGNRKTSAMNPAKNLLRELRPDAPWLNYCADCITKEKMVLDMHEREFAIADLPEEHKQRSIISPFTVMVTELSEFLQAGGVGMVNFLTTIYDQDVYEIRTKNKGDTIITGPYLTLLACTTPDWITTYLRSDIISGGFSRRAIFVLETGKSGRIPFPVITPEMANAWKELVAYSRTLLKVRGPFTWDPEAKTFFKDWYMSLQMPADPMIHGYFETKHMQLLKVSMLLALSDSTDLILRKEHLLFGLDLLKLAEVNLSRVFAGIGRNELNAVANKALELLHMAPEFKNQEGAIYRGLPERTLVARMFNQATQLDMNQVIQYLLDSGKALRILVQSGTNQRAYITLPPVDISN